MSSIYKNDPAFATASAEVVGPCHITYPFQQNGDRITRLYHHPMKQHLANYVPLDFDVTLTDADAKPAGSPFPDDPDAFFVEDLNVQPNEAGFVTFDRVFANIPATRTEPFGFYGYERPGFNQSISFGVYGAIWFTEDTLSKSFTNSPSPSITLTIPATPERTKYFEEFSTPVYGPIFGVVQIKNESQWNVTMPWGSLTTSALIGEVASISGDTFVINNIKSRRESISSGLDPVTSINSEGGATAYQLGFRLRQSEPTIINTAAYQEIDYVKTNDPGGVQLSQVEEIVEFDGDATNLLRNSSRPSLNDYLNDLESGNLRQIENETIARWKGNIYQKNKIMGKIPFYNLNPNAD